MTLASCRSTDELGFVVLPDHIHGIIWLTPASKSRIRSTPADEAAGKGGSRPAPAKPLGAIIGALKTMSARQINVLRGTPGIPFWQRDFYERIVRNEAALRCVREYIRCNPQRWR